MCKRWEVSLINNSVRHIPQRRPKRNSWCMLRPAFLQFRRHQSSQLHSYFGANCGHFLTISNVSDQSKRVLCKKKRCNSTSRKDEKKRCCTPKHASQDLLGPANTVWKQKQLLPCQIKYIRFFISQSIEFVESLSWKIRSIDDIVE